MDEILRTKLRELPKIDEILGILEREKIIDKAPREFIVGVCRSVVKAMRESILREGTKGAGVVRVFSTEDAAGKVKAEIDKLHAPNLRRVINATGIILHTNLGRAPLSDEALAQIIEISQGYSNLEFDLEKGKRGLRYDHIRDILCALTGAEDAMVVNNNAAAVLLVLNTMSEGKEVIVSRGELIEIGGEFRIPEVMEKSGALLREVGTTNRTHFADYEKAIGENTGLILKVHTSNFRIAGFTEGVALPDLVALGRQKGIPVMNDLGSGCFVELNQFGFEREPTVQDALKSGVDVVTFSGDKLLGGPQAGIVLGEKGVVGSVKENPLNRALRIDKLTLAALEVTMKHYLTLDEAFSRIKGLKALTESVEAIEKRATRLLRMMKRTPLEIFSFSVKRGSSMAGGGSLPTQEIPTSLFAVTSPQVSASRLGERLRHLDVPIVARIADDEVLFDLRTVDDSELVFIKEGLTSIENSIRRDQNG